MSTRRSGARARRRSLQGLFAAAIAAMLVASANPAPPPAAAADLIPQTITFSLPPSGVVGVSVELTATSDSGLPVSLVSDTPVECVIVTGMSALAPLVPGTCAVTASQAGDDVYAPATPVQATMTVAAPPSEPPPADPIPQAITFSLPASVQVGATVVLGATADSGLPVGYVEETPGICTVADGTVTATSPGLCRVSATQPGDQVYAPAPSVMAEMTIEPEPPDPLPQAITFELPASTLIGSSLVLGATADSGLPVSYVSDTPGVCAVVEATLTALATGTCTVIAVQPGDDVYAPADDVQASITIEPVPTGVQLGKYAVDGPVRAVVIEPGTGRTYLGGDFDQIGIRTGPVAVVDAPGQGSGGLRSASPEILGTVNSVFVDDRPDDPGILVVGELIAVNGAPVPAAPVTRLHLDEVANRWVVDSSWKVSDPGNRCTGLADSGMWTATPGHLVAGGNTYADNPTGLSFINRTTGACTSSLAGVDQPLPDLDACANLVYCYATVTAVSWDPDAGALDVAYITWVGATSGNVDRTRYVSRYTLVPAAWSWTTELEVPGSPEPDAFVASLVELDGRVLVYGSFPMVGVAEPDSTRFLSIDAATGAIAQRWNRHGEQDLDDGTTIGSADACLIDQRSHGTLFRFGERVAQWVGMDVLLCEYRIVGGSVATATLADAQVPDEFPYANSPLLPTTEYRDGAGHAYVTGPWMAVAVPSGEIVDWHPGPAMDVFGRASVADSSGGLVIGGPFQFVRGDPSPGVVALTASLSPDPSFHSPLLDEPAPRVRALELHDGWLIVGGQFGLPSEAEGYDLRSLVALDPVAGSLVDWAPDVGLPGTVETIAVNPATDEIWAGGSSDWPWDEGPGAALVRFEPPSAGADPLSAPALACLDAPYLPGFAPDDPVCDLVGHNGAHVWSLAFDSTGKLYIGGAFGSVDGSTRRGLARLDEAGHLDSWNPDLYGVLPIPSGSGLGTLEPYSIAAHGDDVIVGGRFGWITEHTHGGGGAYVTMISPLLVLSATNGALLRPTDAAVTPWFPIAGWWSAGYDILARASGVVVAVGDTGVIVLSPLSLDYDTTASAPLVTTNWWGRNSDNGVFALAAAPQAAAAASVGEFTALAADPIRVVLGGTIPRWGYRVAGNVVGTGVAATPPNMNAPSTTAPLVRPRVGAALSGAAAPAKITWTASRGTGVALDHYVVERTTNGGTSWTRLSSTVTTTSLNTTLPSSGTVRFRVRAVNRNGVMGSWDLGPTLTSRLLQQTSTSIRYAGSWTTALSSSYAGGSSRYTRSAGARATYTFTGRSVALVTTRAPTRGKVKVYVNGTYLQTVDLYASVTHHRVVAWERTWTTSGSRTITLIAAGTSGRPRVDIDAFVSIR